MDDSRGQPDAKPVTPIGRLVSEVLARHPDWTQAAIATRAGFERTTLNHYMHTPGRRMEKATRKALAKSMRIEQWEMDEAAAEQAGYELRRPELTYDSHKLLSRINDLSPEQRRLWFRLARSIADTLVASETTGLAPGGDTVTVGIDTVEGGTRLFYEGAAGLPQVVADLKAATDEATELLHVMGDVQDRLIK